MSTTAPKNPPKRMAPKAPVSPATTISSHLMRFALYNVVLALMPLLAAFVVRTLAEVNAPIGAYTQELLFFAVATSATTLGDVIDARFTGQLKWLSDLLRAFLFFSVIASTLLFGLYQYEAILNAGNANIRRNMIAFSLWMAVFTGFVSFFAQWAIAATKRGDGS